MTTGTKSLLFGVHQFIWHPITVIIAWYKLYHALPSWREVICIIIHDWGYWGKENMNGEKGIKHPELAWEIALYLFDDPKWAYFCLYHSRHYARDNKMPPSLLCWADKISILYDPWWFYLPRAWLSGELAEYRKEANNAGLCGDELTHREWFVWIRRHMKILGKAQRGDAVPYTANN
jgi:hypothetical protein